MKFIKTHAIIEQHLHGAYGIDFLNCNEDELLLAAKNFLKDGVTVFLPTLATAPLEQLKRQIRVINNAMKIQKKMPKLERGAKIYGINLEACFISPKKNGIHNPDELLALSVDNFKLVEDEAIKIVTIAPELDKDNQLSQYLHSKGIKVFAGHTEAFDLSRVDGVTHLFNAMSGIVHREKNTVTSALINDNIYCEIIADGYHIDYDVVKLALKAKPCEKVILISDALPITHSDKKEMEFCSKTIYLKNGRATDKNGTIAGSSMLVCDIIKKLVKNGVTGLEYATKMASNPAKLFNFEHKDCIFWDEDLNIVDTVIN